MKLILQCAFLLFPVLLINNNIFADTEPNNTYQQASTLGLNSTSSGSLNAATQTQAADDVDWWKITTSADGSLYVETNATGGLDIDLHIFDIDGVTVIASYNISTGSKESTHHARLMPGTYYIRAYRYSGTGTYTIMNRYVQAIYTDEELSGDNDTWQRATTLLVNSTNYGHIGYYRNQYTDNVDWWKVTVPSDGSLKIRTESDSADIDLFLFDIDGTTQIASYDISTGLNEETHYNSLMPGTYYIKVYRYSKWGAYKIISTFAAVNYQGVATNDIEPNDLYNQAQAFGALPVGSSVKYGHLGYYTNKYTDTKDYWSFTVPQDGSVVVTTESNTTLDIDLYMYDINGTTQIASYELSTGIKEIVRYNSLMPGTYYVQAYKYSGYGAYKITIDFSQAGLTNDQEPNDQISQARTIQPNVLMTGHLGYYSNGFTDVKDYYVITLTTNWDSLYVRTDSDKSLELDLYLYNNASVQVAYAGAYGAKEILRFKSPAASLPYYIEVRRYSGYGSYGIKVTNSYPYNPVTSYKDESAVIPTEYKLSQNYPNPFNPNTTISYQTSKNGHVKITVFDVIGREVQTLVNEEKLAGYYEVKFNAEGLSSGLYFYKIKAGEFSQTRKMLLLK